MWNVSFWELCSWRDYLSFWIEIIGGTLVNKILRVSSVHLCGTPHLHGAVCPPHKAQLFSLTMYLTLYLVLPATPIPSGSHHAVVCVCEFLFVCLSYLFIFYFNFYITRMCELLWSWLFLSHLFCLAWYSQGPSTLLQIATFHLFLWPSSSPLCICTTFSVSSCVSKDSSPSAHTC